MLQNCRFEISLFTVHDRAPLDLYAYCLIRLHLFSSATRLIYATENSLAFHSYRYLVVIAVPYQDNISGIFALLRPLGYVDLANEFLLQLLLYGNKDFPDSSNRHILELTFNVIHKSGRFD